MASTIPRKSLSNSVWLVIKLCPNGIAEVKNVKSVHVSRECAVKAALAKVNKHIEGTDGKIHIYKMGQFLRIGERDWWHMSDYEWMNSRRLGGYKVEKYDVIDGGKPFESTVWIQKLRNDCPGPFIYSVIYDIKGVYGSENLAMAARSTEVDKRSRYRGSRYILEAYQIQ